MSTPPGEYQLTPCVAGQSDDAGNESFVRLFENYNDGVNSVPGESMSNCSISRIPVSGWNGSGLDQYTTLMNDGFLVELKVTSCSDCQKSGGQCGFNTSSVMFMCICSDDHTYPMSCPNSKGTKSNSNIILIGSTIAAALALAIILAVLILKYEKGCIFQRKHGEQKEIEMLIEKYGSLAPRRYNYRELKKITKSFQDKLGKGGFGTVYKGSLRDGRFVAVKFLHNATTNGEEFLNEVISIGRTSHVNVVNLLGFCIEGSKRALIYEYMPNGSLDSYIYSEISRDVLGWEKLYDIAISIARGIEYLHRGCNTRIVHFDIKPQNILLNEEFCPKISDFGLAKLCQLKESIISLAEMRGTVGYIAPEVFSRSFGVPSTKSDVYSYGMMVLEMVGGRKNANQIVESSSRDYFPHWIYNHIVQGGNIQACDVIVETEVIVRKMAMVGLWCIQTLPANRPSMSGVVEMLEKSLDELEMPPKPFLSSPQHSMILSLNSSSG
ncbi:Protein kinase family protein [Rhynchospora pubera]|uniref:non-specific serine/threonine protein kinase n=1 Tax=Rhynchospora pubera TaxID=906938 RepID=A0AAV8D930_9POAL|nr:Protein kinase family protein [Rhynchospora pubera]